MSRLRNKGSRCEHTAKRLPPCPIPEMGMLLSRGFFCRLCDENCFPVSTLRSHFATLHHCGPPRLTYGFVVEGVSVKLVSDT
jgi:hypothetical protein